MSRAVTVALITGALVLAPSRHVASARPGDAPAPGAGAGTKAEKKKEPYTKWPLPTLGGSRSGVPEIILTFDDGPHETWTPKILDELAKRGVKAIFFWVGWRVVKESPRRAARIALVERAIREGHIVANHTIHHDHLCHMKPDRAAEEIDGNAAILEPLIKGMRLLFFRAPYGDYCKHLIRLLDERGLRHLHWDIDPMEWVDHDGVRVSGTLRRKISKLKPDRRAVVIMHDTRHATAVALPLMFDWLEKENARRAKAGQPQVRILDGSDLAAERQDEALAAWAGRAVASVHDQLRALRLLVP